MRPTRTVQNPVTIVRDEEELQTVVIVWTLDESEPPVLARAVKVIWNGPDINGAMKLTHTTIFEGIDNSLDAMVDNLINKVIALT